MNYKIGIVIPCYRSKGLVSQVTDDVLAVAEKLAPRYLIEIIVVDDGCPEMSWKDINYNEKIKLLHHTKNQGVGAACLTGFKYALQNQKDIIVKIDSDGQHLADYLLEIIPYIIHLPKNNLALIKGTRYSWAGVDSNTPLSRRIGSLLLEPIARAALSYRGLTDITNGYLAMNNITCSYLSCVKIASNIESRYLFECSLLEKCSFLSCEIHQFVMSPKYGDKWKSSMSSKKMILPIFFFWTKSIIRRLLQRYILRISLGSLLLYTFLISSSAAIYLYANRVGPEISRGVLVSAGTSAAFTTSISVSILILFLLMVYDYFSGSFVNKVYFRSYIEEIDKK